MALTITTTAPNFPFYVIAPSPLAADAAITVTADTPGVAVISLDPNPLSIASPFDPARGTRSVASGVIHAVAAGTATVKATVLNPDGTTLAEVTDTLTIVDPAPGVADWAGELFGTASPVAPGTTKSSHAAKSHEPEGKSHHTK